MKRFYSLLLLGLMLVPCRAAEQAVTIPGFSRVEAAAADRIGLVGPTTANAGAEVTLRLTGTPPLDLSKPLLDQLGWLMGDGRMFAYVAAPRLPLQPLDVRAEFVFSAAGATMQPLLRVECKAAGEYRVLVDWNTGQDQLAEHLITVGGTPGPVPPPVPPPDPTPPPPLAEMTVIVVEETKERTAEQAWVLLDPTVRQWMATNGHHFRLLDKDLTSADSRPWIDRATAPPATALPHLFISDNKGAVYYDGELPIGPIQMLELVKKWGAEK